MDLRNFKIMYNNGNCNEVYEEITFEELEQLIKEYTAYDSTYGGNAIAFRKIEGNILYLELLDYE